MEKVNKCLIKLLKLTLTPPTQMTLWNLIKLPLSNKLSNNLLL